MRDMTETKFAACCRYLGFSPQPEGEVFVSEDGALRVRGVFDKPGGVFASRLNRRETLAALRGARHLYVENEEATGAGTPVASN